MSISAMASTMTSVQNLFFGTWIPTSSSGRVTVTTSGTYTSSDVTSISGATTPFQGILKYSSTGTLGSVLDVITLTPLSSSVTLTGGTGGTVQVSNFTPQTGLGVTLLNPTVNIPIGGRMTFTGTPEGTFSGSVQVQGSGLLSGTATGTLFISVDFRRTLTAVQQTRLTFGAIEAKGGAAVVRIAAQTGLRSVVSGAANINLVTNPTPAAGAFTVTGQPNASITVTLPSSMTLTGSAGGTMTVNNFTKYPTSTVLNTSGTLTLKVGADLSINATQPAGSYTGTYSVTINY